MRRFLPLASSLALALVASTAFASDAPARRSGRADLLTAHRESTVDLNVRRTDGNRSQAELGTERVVLGSVAAPVLSLPDVPPMRFLGGAGEIPTVDRGYVADVEGLQPRASRGAWVLDAVRVGDDPAVQQALEGRAGRMPSLVAHGLHGDGTEQLFQLR